MKLKESKNESSYSLPPRLREVDGRLLTEDGRDFAAVLLGRRGGLKGGKARAETLSAEKRREIARKAAKARWGKKTDGA